MKHLFLLSLLALPCAAWSQDVTEQRIEFAAGSSGATIEGRIQGYATIDYLLGAAEGQRMKVDFAPDNPSAYFNLLRSDDPNALHVGSTSGNRFDGALPATDDYRIRVYLMRNAARRDEIADYSLSVSITGQSAAAASPPGDFADGLFGGPDWWEITGLTAGDTLNVRTGPGTGNAVIGTLGNGDRVRNGGCDMNGSTRWCQIEIPGDQPVHGWVAGRYLTEAAAPSTNEAKGAIPCAVDQSQPMGSCSFRVSRGSGGTASVWVTLPSGDERYLDFREGKLVGSDPGREVHQERTGDLNLIFIDGIERYEVPDAVIYGG